MFAYLKQPSLIDSIRFEYSLPTYVKFMSFQEIKYPYYVRTSLYADRSQITEDRKSISLI